MLRAISRGNVLSSSSSSSCIAKLIKRSTKQFTAAFHNYGAVFVPVMRKRGGEEFPIPRTVGEHALHKRTC